MTHPLQEDLDDFAHNLFKRGGNDPKTIKSYLRLLQAIVARLVREDHARGLYPESEEDEHR